ncbi:hypothetical protein G5V65_00035 [Rhodobacter sp. HX-7-19]|uniref:Uncharacterized protein n=1 Tax=Paragemmobacter kunshanensis TaxID=2583234 RepID=A0A6M1TQC8_9RHOB|nr:hypothetical protein [Rhodobacter kunshanensis]NGQ89266.1 hypothetical protein [Rhodobacter kunshanensis]
MMVDNLVFQLRDFAARAPDLGALPRPQLRDVIILAAALVAAIAGVM